MSAFSNVAHVIHHRPYPGSTPSYQASIEYGHIDAAMMVPSTTSGAALETKETAGSAINYDRLLFDATTSESAWFKVTMPPHWDNGSFRALVNWEADSGSGGVAFGISARACKDGAVIDSTMGTEVVVTDTLVLAGSAQNSPTFFTITPSGSTDRITEVFFKLRRIPSNAADTLAVDAGVRSLLLQWGNGDEARALS